MSVTYTITEPKHLQTLTGHQLQQQMIHSHKAIHPDMSNMINARNHIHHQPHPLHTHTHTPVSENGVEDGNHGDVYDWELPQANIIDEGTSTVTKVMDGLFISGVDASQDAEFLAAHKINAIINTAGFQCPDMLIGTGGIRYLTFRWSNDEMNLMSSSTSFNTSMLMNPSTMNGTANHHNNSHNSNVTNPHGIDLYGKVVNKIYKFIEYHRIRGDGILIHSIDAHSRAPIACAAYLCKRLGWSVEKSMEFLRSKQPTIQPSILLLRQLQRCVQYCNMAVNHDIRSNPCLQHIVQAFQQRQSHIHRTNSQHPPHHTHDNNPLHQWLLLSTPSSITNTTTPHQQQPPSSPATTAATTLNDSTTQESSSSSCNNPLHELLTNTYINTYLHHLPADSISTSSSNQPTTTSSSTCTHTRTVRWVDIEIPTESLIRIAGRGYNHRDQSVVVTPNAKQQQQPSTYTLQPPNHNKASVTPTPLRNITNQLQNHTIASSASLAAAPIPNSNHHTVAIHTLHKAPITAIPIPTNTSTSMPTTTTSNIHSNTSTPTVSLPLQPPSSPSVSTTQHYHNNTLSLSQYLQQQQQQQASTTANTTLSSTTSLSTIPTMSSLSSSTPINTNTALQQHQQHSQAALNTATKPSTPQRPQNAAIQQQPSSHQNIPTLTAQPPRPFSASSSSSQSSSITPLNHTPPVQPSQPLTASTTAVNSYFQRFAPTTVLGNTMNMNIMNHTTPAQQLSNNHSNTATTTPLQSQPQATLSTMSTNRLASAQPTQSQYMNNPPTAPHRPQPPSPSRKKPLSSHRVNKEKANNTTTPLPLQPQQQAQPPPSSTFHRPSSYDNHNNTGGIHTTLNQYFTVISNHSTPSDGSMRSSFSQKDQPLFNPSSSSTVSSMQPPISTSSASSVLSRTMPVTSSTLNSSNMSSNSSLSNSSPSQSLTDFLKNNVQQQPSSHNAVYGYHHPPTHTMVHNGPVKLTAMLRPSTAPLTGTTSASNQSSGGGIHSIYSTLQKPLWMSGGSGSQARTGSLKKKKSSVNTSTSVDENKVIRSSSHKKANQAINALHMGAPTSSRKKSQSTAHHGSSSMKAKSSSSSLTSSSSSTTSQQKASHRQKLSDTVYRAYIS